MKKQKTLYLYIFKALVYRNEKKSHYTRYMTVASNDGKARKSVMEFELRNNNLYHKKMKHFYPKIEFDFENYQKLDIKNIIKSGMVIHTNILQVT